mgnify:CR=1 FL=1
MVTSMAYRLARDESIPQGALRILQEELSEAVSRLRDPGDVDAGVHGARKAIKRARALLRLVRAGLGPQFARENHALRDAARLLAQRRDAAVAAATFEQLVPEPPPNLVPLRDALLAARDAVAGAAAADPLAAAAADLELAHRRTERWPTFTRGWPVVEAGLKTSYGGGRRAMREAFRDPSPDAFHEWRKRVKDLWYHTLLLQGVWKTVQLAWAGALEDLSDALGEDHDLEVLRLAVAALPDTDPEARRELLARADDRSSELRTAARTLGQRIYAEPPRRYLARMRRYWEAWRSDERRAAEARRVADAAPPRPEAPPSEVVPPPCPPEPAPADMPQEPDT